MLDGLDRQCNISGTCGLVCDGVVFSPVDLAPSQIRPIAEIVRQRQTFSGGGGAQYGGVKSDPVNVMVRLLHTVCSI